jgi:hypothetical protein
MQSLRAADHRISNKMPVEGGELTSMCASQGKQVRVGDLPGIEQAREPNAVPRPHLSSAACLPRSNTSPSALGGASAAKELFS